MSTQLLSKDVAAVLRKMRFIVTARSLLSMVGLFVRSVFWKEYLLKLAQAVEASQEQSAYRVVGALRILVHCGNQKLRVLVQCRNRQHWTLTDASGGVRYLNGVLRDMDGSWVIDRCDIIALDSVAHCLPAAYQHLLALDSDDWQTIAGKKLGERC
jgi:hypothetical protein